MKDRILIIDDARTVRVHLQLMLGGQYECVVAEDATAGLALARSLAPPPRAILLDIQMPGTSGIEALREIKSDTALRDIPVIMVTARGEDDAVRVCREAGCDAYVTKPVQGTELFNVLRSLVKRTA